MQIKFSVTGQELQVTQETMAGDTINYLEAQASFSPEWEGLSKWAHFKCRDQDCQVALEGNRITRDKGLNLAPGIWRVWLHGTSPDGMRITTTVASLEVKHTGSMEGGPLPEILPSAAEQMDARITKLEEGGPSDAVRYGERQQLAPEQQTRARENIGAASKSGLTQKAGISDLVKSSYVAAEKSGNLLLLNSDYQSDASSIVTDVIPDQEGSGVPSLNNRRSIHGVNSVGLYKRGKNLVDSNAVFKNASVVKAYSPEYHKEEYPHGLLLKAGVTYTARVFSSVIPSEFSLKNLDGTKIDYHYSDIPITYRPQKDTECYLDAYWANAGCPEDAVIQMEASDEVKAFTGYSAGGDLLVDFPEEKYGGVYNWITGVFTQQWVSKTLDGTEPGWQEASVAGRHCWLLDLPRDMRPEKYNAECKCDIVKPTESYGEDHTVYLNAYSVIFIFSDKYLSEVEWRAFLKENNVTIVYRTKPKAEQYKAIGKEFALTEGINTLWVKNQSVNVSYYSEPVSAAVEFVKGYAIGLNSQLEGVHNTLDNFAVTPVLRNGAPLNTGNTDAVCNKFVIPTYGENSITVKADFDIARGNTYLVWGAKYEKYFGEDHESSNREGSVFFELLGTTDRFITVDVKGYEGVAVAISERRPDGSFVPKRVSEYPSAFTILYGFASKDGNTEQKKRLDGFAVGNEEKAREFCSLFSETEDIESFLFFSDPHLQSHSPEQMGEILSPIRDTYRHTPTSFCLCGGDWLNMGASRDEACYMLGAWDAYMRKNCAPYVPVFGNHDNNYLGKEYMATAPNYDLAVGRAHMIPRKTMRNLFFREEGRAYYKYNAPMSSVYVIDTENGGWGNPEWDNDLAYRNEQLGWLAKDLKESDPRHSFLACHIAYSGGGVGEYANEATKIMRAYNERSSISVAGKQYDFSGCTGVCHFVISGHEHKDYNGVVNGIPVIVTTQVKDTTHPGRSWPTFDLCLADYTKKKLHLIRVGNGNNRTIDIL